MGTLLTRIFRLSYQAIVFCQDEGREFNEWVHQKGRLNRELNTEIFHYLATARFERADIDAPMQQQFGLDVIEELVGRHLRVRILLYRLAKKLPIDSERVFVRMAWLHAYVSAFAECILAVLAQLRKFRLDMQLKTGPITLAIGFPAHAFAIRADLSARRRAEPGPYPSFGEYLLDDSAAPSNLIVSVGEYVRKEGSRSSGDRDDETVWACSRLILPWSISLTGFVWNCPGLLLSMCRAVGGSLKRPSLVLLELGYFRKSILSRPYMKLIAGLERSGHPVTTIFILPFQWPGLFKYTRRWSDRFRTFFYSDNILLLPAPGTHPALRGYGELDADAVLSEVPLTAFRHYGRGVGFSNQLDFIGRAKAVVNRECGSALPAASPKADPRRLAVLGFETFDRGGHDPGRSIAVFDVPPESRETQLGRAFAGAFACDFSFIREFVEDVGAASERHGFHIVFKPKYSLSYYSSAYRAMLDSLVEAMKGRCVLASPYANLNSLVHQVDACISIPYTSTKEIGKAFGKPSVYYTSEQYREQFTRGRTVTDFVVGIWELDSFLSGLNRDRAGSKGTGSGLETIV